MIPCIYTVFSYIHTDVPHRCLSIDPLRLSFSRCVCVSQQNHHLCRQVRNNFMCSPPCWSSSHGSSHYYFLLLFRRGSQFQSLVAHTHTHTQKTKLSHASSSLQRTTSHVTVIQFFSVCPYVGNIQIKFVWVTTSSFSTFTLCIDTIQQKT